MMQSYRLYPKVELHSHLDCTLSYFTVSQLVPGITREQYAAEYVAPLRCNDLAGYLACTLNGVALLQSMEALELAAWDLYEQMALDHVIYSEARFAPLLHIEAGLTPEQVVDTVQTACSRASRETGIEVGLILCTLCHYSAEQSLQTVRLVEAFAGTQVCGLDIAGDEAGYELDEHVPAFEYAISHNIYRTAHAGEARGAASVWDTLKRFQPNRIGHGIRSIEDPVLMDHLHRKRIHLEVCPQSNVQTEAVADLSEHPVQQLYEAGLSVGINTDSRGITAIDLTEEYQQLVSVFGWGPEHFLTCNLNAVEAAFLPQDAKDRLSSRLISAYRPIEDGPHDG
jgi:adenosine deaminase